MIVDYYRFLVEWPGRNKGAEALWRPGQRFFNVLAEYHPELAEKIRGTDIDPFYDDHKIKDAIEFLVKNWYETCMKEEQEKK